MPNLSFKGHTAPSEYFKMFFTVFVAQGLLLWLLENKVGADTTAIIYITLASLALMWWQFATTRRRLRSADASGYWLILLFIPFVAFVFGIAFGCWKDDK